MLLPYRNIQPQIDSSVFVAENATIIGDVIVGAESSIWFNVVMRGDVNFIRIGSRTNIQDGSVVHVTHDTHPTVLGDDITVGHNVTLHGCVVHNGCLIGIGSCLLDGVEIAESCLVAAGSVVAPGTNAPPRSLIMGAPARVVRELSDDECGHLLQSAHNYVDYRAEYLGLKD